MNIQFGSKLTALWAASSVIFMSLALSILTLPTSAHADGPAFEAYYKFFLGNKHSGFVIQRFEVHDTKKEMISTYYCFVKTPSGSTTESLLAYSDLNFEPISYQYTALADGKPKLVDAVFKNKKMTATIIENGRSKKVTLAVKPNGFLSTFLNYVILKNGLSTGKNYNFFALSEEDPAFHEGTANIAAEQKVKNIDAFKIDFNYKGVSFVGLVANNGEPLGTLSPEQNASTEMVATRAEAVGSLPFNEKQISTLFKGLPEGKNNKMNRATVVAEPGRSTVATPTQMITTDSAKPANAGQMPTMISPPMTPPKTKPKGQ